MDPSWIDTAAFMPLQATYAVHPSSLNPSAPVGWDVTLDPVTGLSTTAHLPPHRRPGRRTDPASTVSARTPTRGMRVGKLASAGSSPKTSLKRRTSSSTTTATTTGSSGPVRWRSSLAHPHRSISKPMPRSSREVGRGPHAAEIQSRPLTWHPSSHPQQISTVPSWDPYRSSSGEAMAMWSQPWSLDGTIQWKEPSTPSLYPASETTSPVIPCSPPTSTLDLLDVDLYSLYDPNTMDSCPTTYPGLSVNGVSQPPPKLSLSIPDVPSSTGLLDSDFLSMYDPSTLSSSFPFSTSATTLPEPTSFLPIQLPEHESEQRWSTNPSPEEELPSHQGEQNDGGGNGSEGELVGMGLYDDVVPSRVDVIQPPDLSRLTLRSRAVELDQARRRRPGKGLKLEERWEPPETKEQEQEQEPASEPIHGGDGNKVMTGPLQDPTTSPAWLDPDIFTSIAPATTTAAAMTMAKTAGSFLLDDTDPLDDRHYRHHHHRHAFTMDDDGSGDNIIFAYDGFSNLSLNLNAYPSTSLQTSHPF